MLRRGTRVAAVRDGRIVMTPNGEIIHLNEDASKVFEALMDRGLDHAIITIQALRGLTPTQARTEVRGFVEQLRVRRVVRHL